MPGPGRRQPRHRPSLQPRPPARTVTSGSRATSPTSRSAGAPSRGPSTSSTRRRSRASRGRSASRSQSHASGPTATLNLLEAARQAGVRRFMFAASSSAYGETERAAQARGDAPQPAQPLRRGQARRRALRPRLRPDDGARRREPPLLQRLRPAAGPVEPLQRRDLAVRHGDVARAGGRRSTATARRRATSPTSATSSPRTSPPCRSPSPLGGAALNVGTGRRISLLDLVAAINQVLGTHLEPEFQPAPRRRPRLAGQPRPDHGGLGYEPLVDFEEGLRRTLEATTPSEGRIATRSAVA